ncbi:MAG: hypothetical protein ACTHJ8_19465 [Mucilaginibacter sp.]
MKADHNMTKKVLSASLLIVYFFIALTYIQFLPNYTARRLNNVIHHTSRLTAGAYGNGSSSHAILQKFFKSTPENKRNLTADFSQVAILIGSAITAAFIACRLILVQVYNPVYAVTRKHVYLQYRSLRI